MFINPDKIQNLNEPSEERLPDAFVDYLSKSLPEGIKYEQLSDGFCVVVPEKGDSIIIGGFTPKLTEIQKKVLGEKYTYEELLSYMYNSQTPIEMVPIDGENVIINGNNISEKLLFCHPKDPIDLLKTQRFMIPEKFPDPHPITLSIDNIFVEIMIHRIPDNSIYRMVFESLESEYLYVRFTIDNHNHTSSLTVKAKAEMIKTVDEVISSMKIVNAFLDRTLCINGSPLSGVSNKEEHYFSDDSIEFWEKLLQIERKLKCSFIPTKETISYSLAYEVERIYQNLINQTPIVSRYNVDYVNGLEDVNDHVKENIGKEVFFTFRSIEAIELLGVKLELPTICCVFNCVFEDIITDGNKYRIKLANASEDKPRYTSVLSFANEEDINQFDFDKNFDSFKNAKKVSQYIK